MNGPDEFAGHPGAGTGPSHAGPGEPGPDAAIRAMTERAAVQAALQTTASLRQRSLQDFLR
jgi:hypothetical protein